jgi:hypothetical protein
MMIQNMAEGMQKKGCGEAHQGPRRGFGLRRVPYIAAAVSLPCSGEPEGDPACCCAYIGSAEIQVMSLDLQGACRKANEV